MLESGSESQDAAAGVRPSACLPGRQGVEADFVESKKTFEVFGNLTGLNIQI